MATASLRIDLDAVRANWRALDAMTTSATESGAVVKADSYGLGGAQVARLLARAGCRKFFVAVAEEGAAIRQALGEGPEIFVFSGHMAGDTEMIGDLGLIPMLNSVEQVTRHLEALPGAPFGVQLDTGMNRLGMEAAEWQAVAPMLLGANPKLIMSHLACSDEPDHPMNAQQLAAFRAMTDGIAVPRSLSATGGILLGPDYHFDVTRPGIGMYGGAPFTKAAPVVTLSLPVIQIRDVAAGETVGYGNTWTAEQECRIATVAAGYADGVTRHLSNAAMLYHGATHCPMRGRVSMDLITADVTHLTEVPKSLDLICPHQGIDVLADIAGTIGYEILTSLGPRYSRHYTGGPA
ncbi:alanine racemase [Rhodobacter sp. TJ_12]|uniref:alanine racemase n=1 Tax=Rhodobacter sp. TJ_12 TaxID=2029399 RepID=UPI001CBB3F9E|nr:alanine racemase [Rhodobacter sp. TJ_12]MBZ4022957.1 alanine racemase [Rhodobacter sp. TJ_12]